MYVLCVLGLIRQEICQDVSQVEQSSGGAYVPIAITAR